MERYEVFLKPSAVREIESIDTKKARTRIVSRIRGLAGDPRPRGCEKLSETERYRIRQGPFRIVYGVDDGAREVTVFKVGHRRDVYRRRP